MRRRSIGGIGSLVVIGVLIWRAAGMPGLGGNAGAGDGAGGAAAGSLVAQQLEEAARSLTGLGDARSGPGMHIIDPAVAPAGDLADRQLIDCMIETGQTVEACSAQAAPAAEAGLPVVVRGR